MLLGLQNNDKNNDFSIENIVKTINLQDIKLYVQQQMFYYQYDYKMSEIDDVIKSKVEDIKIELINKGYRIYNDDYFDVEKYNLKQEILNLQKHNKFLQHNVSVLQKKLNKIIGD